MKLKRLQVVTAVNGKRVIQLEGRAIYHSITDLTTERGVMMFNRLLMKRLASSKTYVFGKRLDVAAMMVTSYYVGEVVGDSHRGLVAADVEKPDRLDQVVACINSLAEAPDTTDAIMELQGWYMIRYASLFIHLYGDRLTTQGVNIES